MNTFIRPPMVKLNLDRAKIRLLSNKVKPHISRSHNFRQYLSHTVYDWGVRPSNKSEGYALSIFKNSDSKGPKFNLLSVIKIFRWYSKVTWRIISLKLGLWLFSIGLLPPVPYGAHSIVNMGTIGNDMGTMGYYGHCPRGFMIKDF